MARAGAQASRIQVSTPRRTIKIQPIHTRTPRTRTIGRASSVPPISPSKPPNWNRTVTTRQSASIQSHLVPGCSHCDSVDREMSMSRERASESGTSGMVSIDSERASGISPVILDTIACWPAPGAPNCSITHCLPGRLRLNSYPCNRIVAEGLRIHPGHFSTRSSPMKLSAVSRVALHVGVVGLLVCFCVNRAETQDPTQKPTFGKVDLKAGFPNDPYVVKVIAGGDIETKLG